MSVLTPGDTITILNLDPGETTSIRPGIEVAGLHLSFLRDDSCDLKMIKNKTPRHNDYVGPTSSGKIVRKSLFSAKDPCHEILIPTGSAKLKSRN